MKKRITSQMYFVKSKAPCYNEEELEIILVLQGVLNVHKMERSFVLREGEFTLINKHVVHYLNSEKGAHILVTKIKLDQFTHVFNRIECVEFLNNNEIYDVDRPLKNRLNAILIDILVKLYQDTDKDNEFEENQLMEMLILNYQLITHIKEAEEYPTKELMDRYYQIVEYIMSNIHKKITSDDIVKFAYMNPTYFSQFMKRIGGVGFKEFVFYRKLIMTCKYLLDPDITMNDIALKVGITDMKSYYTNFKRKFNVSPSKWRGQMKTILDDYNVCQDMVVFQTFKENAHIHRHRDNTMTHVLKRLIELKEANKDMRDMTIEFNPYDAMGSEYDEDYQVYKHYGAITRIRIEQGATLLIHFPMKYLMEEHQCQLLMSALHEHVLLFGLQAMRKDLFMFHATNEDEFKRSGEIISLIDRKVGNLRMINTFSI